jgi:hypothetical protein
MCKKQCINLGVKLLFTLFLVECIYSELSITQRAVLRVMTVFSEEPNPGINVWVPVRIHVAFIFFMAQQPLLGQGLLIIEASRSHLDTPHSVGLFWTSDQPDAETSTWQHTTLTRDIHPCLGGIRTRNPSKQEAADPSLRPRDHWDRPVAFTSNWCSCGCSRHKFKLWPMLI